MKELNKACPFYLKEGESLPNQQELQRDIGSADEQVKDKALRRLIVAILHDSHYPRMIMTVLQSISPT